MSGVTSIGDASGRNELMPKSEMWNIADGYTKIKILKLLIELDMYETIAKFGYRDSNEEIRLEDIPYKRVDALHRELFILEQLIGNAKFTIKKGYDENVIEGYLERLENVKKYMEYIATKKTNNVTHEEKLNINEEHFNTCFNIMKRIKDDLNTLLNKAGLIFKQSDELDIDFYLDDVIG